MGISLLLKKGLKKHKGVLTGIGLLFFIVTFTLIIALTVFVRSGSTIQQEMTRVGYGDLTTWVREVPDLGELVSAMEAVEDVAQTTVQPLLFAGYQLNGVHSDNEGQLLAYDPQNYPYHFLNATLNGYEAVEAIAEGMIYLSTAMKSSFDVEIGDTILFN